MKTTYILKNLGNPSGNGGYQIHGRFLFSTTEIHQWLGFNIATQAVAGYIFLIVAAWHLQIKHRRLKKQPCQENDENPHSYKQHLRNEVVGLQAELHDQMKLNKLLQCAIHGPDLNSTLHLYSSVSSTKLPLEVKVLLAELAVVEEEILLLEKKVGKLKHHLHRQQRVTNKYEMRLQNEKSMNIRCFSDLGNKKELTRYNIIRDSKKPSSSQTSTLLDETWTEDMVERSRILESQSLNQRQLRSKMKSHSLRPNELSEQLIKCMIDMFLKMHHPSIMDCHGTNSIQNKLTIPCVSSTFSCKSSALLSSAKTCFDPYGVLSDIDSSAARDIGPYSQFIPITRGSLDISYSFHSSNGNLKVLLHKLSHVDLTNLGYKQKLAFWINIYNACVMHAFLQHGLPSSQDKSLSLMNKAALNVGGIVLNALAMEHFILRHPCESTVNVDDDDDQEEMLLRHAYGLGYPEPNITFALCRGTWSSPALRVYTAEDVVNELGRARVEYLEAAIGITSKKRIVVPKLLEWHMKELADDMESLVEWIYSHIPRNGSLKRLIMECLNGDVKSRVDKLVVIQPYDSEFRYLIHV